MTIQRNQEMWQEYSEYMRSFPPRVFASENTSEIPDQKNTRIESDNAITPLTPTERQELKISGIAEQECKTPAQWRKKEAEDTIKINALGSPRHKSADECLEQSRRKLQIAHDNENRIQAEIDKYTRIVQDKEEAIIELSITGFKNRLRSAKNKQSHAKGCIVILEQKLAKQSTKIKHHEYLFMKWLGINEKLKLAYIKQEIRDEKAGIGNTYGYNPKAKSRETAEIMFHD